MNNKSDDIETEEGQLRRAYSIAFKLKNSNLDSEIIYARLEKQGISEEIAKKVIADLSTERRISNNIKTKEFDNIALVKISIAVVIFIIMLLFLPGFSIVPIGLLLSGILYFLLKK